MFAPTPAKPVKRGRIVTPPWPSQSLIGQAPLTMGGGPMTHAMLVVPSVSFTSPPAQRGLGRTKVRGFKLEMLERYSGSQVPIAHKWLNKME